MKHNYTFYYGERVLTAVIAESEDEAWAKAKDEAEKFPTIHTRPGEAPFEYRAKLERATVKSFKVLGRSRMASSPHGDNYGSWSIRNYGGC